jgi:hypothetical protein
MRECVKAWKVRLPVPRLSAVTDHFFENIRGDCGPPFRAGNTKASSDNLPRPSAIRSSSCCLRCSRRASMTMSGKVTSRRPARVFGVLNRGPPAFVCSSASRTLITFSISRSTFPQRSGDLSMVQFKSTRGEDGRPIAAVSKCCSTWPAPQGNCYGRPCEQVMYTGRHKYRPLMDNRRCSSNLG